VIPVIEPTRWTAKAVLSWKPILTFGRRRLELLDWFEANVEPVAFTDTQEAFGIALGTPSQRLQLDRRSLQIGLLDPGASVLELQPALVGLWEVIVPAKVILQSYRAAWSVPLTAEYEAARRTLTERSLASSFDAGVEAFDCACLVDVRTPVGELQLEFGVVTADEIAERLKTTGLGMTPTGEGDRDPYRTDASHFPQVSLFVDVRGEIRRPIGESSEVASALERIERQVGELVLAIAQTL